ncbi:MAG: hypothetical protein JNJ82_04420 [Opitutaceae bacterium]|nr:hypothetical protein [Opitutaceae bacterium]
MVAPAAAQIDIVVGQSREDFKTRYRETYRISRELSISEVERLKDFLRRPPAAEQLSESELATLKNNVADVLISQSVLPERLFRSFITMYGTSDLGEIWRGYIVQKMPELCLRLTNADERSEGVRFLWDRAGEEEGPFLAEAVLGLDRLHAKRPELVSAERMSQNCAAWVASPARKAAARRIVLQVLVNYDAPTARRLALQFLAKESDILLKASALATLGLIGNASDRPAVEAFRTHPDMRLSEAASAALKRLGG